MKIGRIALTATTIWAALATAASAQGPARPAWQVNWGEQYCTLIRPADPAVPFVIGFRTIPGSAVPSIVVMAEAHAHPPQQVSALAFGADGPTMPVTAILEPRSDHREALILSGLNDRLWDSLAGASMMELRTNDGVALRVPLAQTRAARTALDACVSARLRDWQVDEAALRALRARPTSTNGYGIENGDYPIALLRANVQGQVVARIDVSAAGRATACTPVASSGNSQLDDTSCRAVLARGRFSPAIGADGQPTAARIVAGVKWSVTDYP